MRTFSIDSENNITATASAQQAQAGESFGSEEEWHRITADWPASRLLDTWNSFWHPMSSDQEQQVCDVLVNLGWLENDHALHAEGVRAILGVLHCSRDEAKAELGDLRSRKLIEMTITRAGSWMLVSPCRWRSADGYGQ